MHSAQIGLAGYTYNGLLHPDATARALARDWWGPLDRAGRGARRGRGGRAARGPSAPPTQPSRRVASRSTGELLEHIHRLADQAELQASRRCSWSRRHCRARFRRRSPRPGNCWPTVRALPSRCGWSSTSGTPSTARSTVRTSTLEQWLRPLAPHVGVLHLQNHDFRSDAHWGWPDARGSYDPQQLARDAAACGLADVPVFLELFFPFEQDDAEVLARVESSVAACR